MTAADPLLGRLRSSFSGEVIGPGDAQYEGARRVWSAQFDRHPALIVRPANVADVAAAVRFARERDLVVASICHAPQLLIEAGVVKGRKMTCYTSVKTDLKNAGAHYEDREVVVDGNLVTSRQPADLPAFMRETVRVLRERRVLPRAS